MLLKLVDVEVVSAFSTLNMKGTSMLEVAILTAIAAFVGSYCVLDINEEE